MAAEREFDLASIDGTNGTFIGGVDLSTVDGSNYAGYVVKDAGDVNGDGFDDITVAINDAISIAFAGIDSNESYVVFGSAAGFENSISLSDLGESDGSQGFVLKGNGAYSRSGTSVSGVGDVNGDGIDDVIVGDYAADPNGDDSGAGYVVFGTTAGFDSEIDLTSLGNSDGSQGFAINGIAARDSAGRSVSGAGDVNSDGIDDLIISAYTADANGEESGESYVIFGSASGFGGTLELSSLDETSGFVLEGLSAGDRLGISVSEAGDINGDGIDNLVFGAYGTSQSYVVFGSADGFDGKLDLASLDGNNGFTVNVTGNFVSSAGDVNGDGVGDLALSTGSGESYVIFGRADGFDSSFDVQGLDGTNGFAIDGGNAISGAGDFNGDGFDDVVVGDGFNNVVGDSPFADGVNGTSYVIFGSASGFNGTFELSNVDGINGFVINGFPSKGRGGNAGYSVGSADFNGDGFDDLLIGTTLPRYDSFDRETRGPNEIYVVFGQPESKGAIALNDDFSTDENAPLSGNVLTNDTSVDPERTNNLSITAVNGAAANLGSQITLNSGALLTLNAGGTFSYDPNGRFARLNNNAINVDSFSYVVTDGVATDTATVNITVNGISDPPTGTPSAATFNLANLDGSNGFSIDTSDSPGSSDRSVVSGIGDINGDGFDDAIAVNYVIFGSENSFGSELSPESLDGSNGFTLSGALTNEDGTYDIGISSASRAGDINGDGFDDFVVGDQGFSGSIRDGQPGRSYIVFGKADGFDRDLDLTTLDGNNGFIVEGSDDSLLGASVSGAGDINGDGIDDLIVGAPFFNPFGGGTGSSFVVFGREDGFERKLSFLDLDGRNGFTLEGINRTRYGGDSAGASVGGAGDINGDGIDDVVIGAPGGNEGYVVFGNSQGFDSTFDLANLNGTNGFVIDGVEGIEGTGVSVSRAGDINGDGLDDVVIGASRYGRSTSASYVVFGRAEGFGLRFDLADINGANGFAITGVEANEGLGVSVSGAGDVNRDGIDDLIVGSSNANFDSNGPGNSYIIYGSTSPFGSNISVDTLDGNEGFTIAGVGGGASVSDAGDFNGDGTTDLIIGESQFTEGESLGTGYVIYGPVLGNDPLIQAQPDTFTTDSDTVVSGNVFSDNGSGADLVAENTTLSLSETDAELGTPVTLPSGALLTLRADGTFDYDPNGQFDNLDNFDKTTDSFSYTLTNGTLKNATTVTLTIDGAFETPTPSTAFGAELDVSKLDGRSGFTITNTTTDNYSLGFAVSDAGDINGDGVGDIIFSRYDENYVVFGSSAGFSSPLDISEIDGTNGFVIQGEAFINAFDAAGDVNGDGLDDLVVGASSFENNTAGYVVFGSEEGFGRVLNLSAIDGSNGLTIERAPDSSDSAPPVVSGIGDINGDGLDDFLLADSIRPTDDDEGYAVRIANYIVFGNAEGFDSTIDLSALDGTNGFVLQSTQDFVSIKGSADGVGDVNGDGIDDFIIGNEETTVTYADPPGDNGTYVVFGSKEGFESSLSLSSLEGTRGFKLSSAGLAVSGAGDVNGDGLNDLIVETNGEREIAAVLFGSADGFDSGLDLNNLNGENGFVVTPVSGGFRGNVNKISDAGDINNDGLDDLLISDSGSDRGYIIFGSTDFDSRLSLFDLNGRNGFEINGISKFNLAPYSISSADDVNGDGIDDVVLGSLTGSTTSFGEGYVIFGRASVPVTPLTPVGGGTAGDDGITGTTAADRIEALAGNDVLNGKQGDDLLDGGEGTDTALYQFDAAGVTVDLAAGIATDGFGNTDTLVSIENVIGSDFNDAIKGNDQANSLTGGKGKDTLEGSSGDDTLLGGNSADRLVGGAGADRFLYVSIAEGGDTIADFETGIDKLLIVGSVFGGGLSKGSLSAEQFFTGSAASLGSQRLGYNPNTSEVLFDADGAGEASAQILATLSEGSAFGRDDITVI